MGQVGRIHPKTRETPVPRADQRHDAALPPPIIGMVFNSTHGKTMTSLLTNTAAMVALQTLSQINHSLNETNNRVSTGLRISQASDSAAYWAIATTTQSDNGALSAVKDALSIGKSTLDVAYNGLDATRDSLQKLKELLLAARQPGVDRVNIQAEIDGLITDMENKASASVINGQNFLSVDTDAPDFSATKSIVASFERSSTGIAVSTIDLDIWSVMLIDPGSSDNGLLDKGRPNITAVHTHGGAFRHGILALRTYEAFSTTEIMRPIADLTDSVTDLADLEAIIGDVDAVLSEVIAAQNQVGVNLARAESQHGFISALMDANERAIGALVDANMEEESTRLRALQTQQQLSVESLSVANASAQNILALFR
ncbi:flagellin [Acuticoccus sp.]|uniref:flagellin N-terminal helical domain-containing protein n=1 Tax=Acuticoccus sp. TaxID=1904378 RepID=UPI003B52AB68